MTQTSLLSDEMVRHLVAVAHVDILVGMHTLDNAATVGPVARAIHKSFATDFLRERTALINTDGGSQDGTPEIVRGASKGDEVVTESQGLRTIHRISAPYRGVPGKGTALRTLFAAADLLQARAVAVFDPEVTSLTPEWLSRLIRPIYEGRADFVLPAFTRHPLEGPLVSQLVRPLMRATYGGQLHDPVAGEFACSGAFAARCLAAGSAAWESVLGQEGVEVWLPLEAMAGGFKVAQVPLGVRTAAAGPVRPGLPEVFRQVVGALFAALERHQAFWKARPAAEPVPVVGELPAPPETAPAANPQPMAEAFRSGARDLAPLLAQILTPATLQAVEALAADTAPPRYGDELWATTVGEAAGAYGRGSMHRDHIVQALVPLYLGRAATFLLECGPLGVTAVEARLEELGRRFEAAKPELLRAWNPVTQEVSNG